MGTIDSSPGRRAVRGLALSLSATGARSVAQLATLPILARLLSPTTFGLLAAGMVTVRLAEQTTQLGIGPALIQRGDVTIEDRRVAATVSVLLAIVAAGAVWLSADLVAAGFRMPALAPVVRGLTGLFLLNGLAVVPLAMSQRRLSFGVITGVETAAFVLGYAVTTPVLAALGLGIWALVVGAYLESCLRLLGLATLTGDLDWRPSWELSRLRDLLRFGVGLTLAQLAGFLSLQGDNFVVGRWLGAEALGFYGRAYSLSAKPVNLLGSAAQRVLFPAFSQAVRLGEAAQAGFRIALRVTALLSLPAATALFLLAPEIVRVLLGAGWEEVVAPLRFLAPLAFLRAIQKITAAAVQAAGAVYHQAGIQALYGTLVIVGAWIGRPWGLRGVAVAVTLAASLHLVLMMGLALRRLRVSLLSALLSLLPAAATAAVTGLVLWALLLPARGAGGSPFGVLVLGLVLVAAVALAAWTGRRALLGADWLLVRAGAASTSSTKEP